MQGKIIETKTVTNSSINISLEGQPTATYFSSVVKSNQMVKTNKIVK